MWLSDWVNCSIDRRPLHRHRREFVTLSFSFYVHFTARQPSWWVTHLLCTCVGTTRSFCRFVTLFLISCSRKLKISKATRPFDPLIRFASDSSFASNMPDYNGRSSLHASPHSNDLVAHGRASWSSYHPASILGIRFWLLKASRTMKLFVYRQQYHNINITFPRYP